MKLINPILLTLNNTLHIKADNLEPVEVDKGDINEIKQIAYNRFMGTFNAFEYQLLHGINISQLSDRIEVRKIYVHKRESLNNFVYRAFLIPEKEDKCKCFRLGEGSKWQTYNCEIHNENLNECLEIVDKKSYTIEEIEKAINGVKLVPHYDEILKIIKKQILNNLKKLTNTY